MTELEYVADGAGELRTLATSGDIDAARPVANQVAEHAAAARSLTSDPVWRAFEFVPWLGPNLTAVREVAEITDSVAADAVTPVLDAAASIDLGALGLRGSTVDLEPFAEVEAPLAAASSTLNAAETRALAIDADATLPPLANAVRQMRGIVTEAATAIGTLHGAAVLLPTMLGAEEPRTYIIAMQNNAELRSSGGIVGALALLRADRGTISIVRQASTRDFPPLDDPLPLSESTVALFQEGPGRYIQNATSIPDFTEAGAMIAQRWEQRFDQRVDGVVAVDTIVAEHLLSATGPVSFGSFTVDEENIVDVLLSDIYSEFRDPVVQDEVFARAATALFGAALNGGDPRALLGALAAASDENRIRIWSAHEDEQATLASSTLAGALPTDAERGPTVGVLFNDATGGKMDFYTGAEIATAVGVCHGEPTTRVRVTWTNEAPADAAETLPPYVTGDGYYDVEPGSVRTLIAVYGPQGGTPSRIDRDGTEEPVQTAVLDGRTAVQHAVTLAPGESTTISVDFVGTGAGERLTNVVHTPLIDSPDMRRENLECE